MDNTIKKYVEIGGKLIVILGEDDALSFIMENDKMGVDELKNIFEMTYEELYDEKNNTDFIWFLADKIRIMFPYIKIKIKR